MALMVSEATRTVEPLTVAVTVLPRPAFPAPSVLKEGTKPALARRHQVSERVTRLCSQHVRRIALQACGRVGGGPQPAILLTDAADYASLQSALRSTA